MSTWYLLGRKLLTGQKFGVMLLASSALGERKHSTGSSHHMKKFYFVGGPKIGQAEEFFRRLNQIGGSPSGGLTQVGFLDARSPVLSKQICEQVRAFCYNTVKTPFELVLEEESHDLWRRDYHSGVRPCQEPSRT